MTSITPIVMPKWGLSMSEGTLVAWLLDEGTSVEKGDEIAEIESPKITNVFESPASGLLRRHVLNVGDVAPVGALLAVLAPEDVSDTEIDAYVDEFVVEDADEEGASVIVEREAKLDGRSIYYKLAGEGTEGKPVVLIHGFGGDTDNWLLNLEALATDRPVYAIDLPGHGKSSKEISQGDLDELAAAAIAVMKEEGVQQAHLVGHSLGAAVAFAVLQQRPELVASVAGLAPAGLGESINDEYISNFIAAEKRKDVKSTLKLLVADPSQVSTSMIEGVQRFKRIEGVKDALSKIAEKTLPQGRQTMSFRDLLGTMEKPCLIVWGDKDAIIDPDQSEGLPSQVTLIRLPDVGHMPHLEAASTVNEKLSEHFQRS
jgi:pyruvate dehydrogenase E2 component (dihydrolipoyllysine-residue acetyltransferase)